MSNRLVEKISGIGSKRPAMWIDGWRYGEYLLCDPGGAPWDDLSAWVTHFRQLQGLLDSDILTVDIGAYHDHLLATNPGLLQHMGSKKRRTFPLRTLLGDVESKNQVLEMVNAVCSSYTEQPVVLRIPSPKSWTALAYSSAHSTDAVDVGWDDAESSSMFVADYLRTFGETQICGILIVDDTGTGPANNDELKRYQPVLNVAAHYRWSVVLDGCGEEFRVDSEQGVAYTLCDTSVAGTGRRLPAESWQPDAELPRLGSGEFWYATVPQDTVPERTLEVLNVLRSEVLS